MVNAFQSFLQQLASIQTSDVPLIEWHHKLCLLAVVMEEKPAFAIGFDEAVPPRLVHFLDQQAPLLRLFVRETPRPPRDYVHLAKVPPAVADAIAAKWDLSARSSDHILWVYKDPSREEVVRKVAEGAAGVHEALGYPDCCAAAYREDRADQIERYYGALRDEHGAGTEADALRLISENVPVTATPPGVERAIQTVSRFPYLPYIACCACLAEGDSEASRQNGSFRRAIATIDPMSARKILVLAKTTANFGQGLRG